MKDTGKFNTVNMLTKLKETRGLNNAIDMTLHAYFVYGKQKLNRNNKILKIEKY